LYGVGSSEAVDDALRLFERALALGRRGRRGAGAAGDLLHDLSGVHFNAGSYAKRKKAEARALEIRPGSIPKGTRARRRAGGTWRSCGSRREG
jgi:hypothetical protein